MAEHADSRTAAADDAASAATASYWPCRCLLKKVQETCVKEEGEGEEKDEEEEEEEEAREIVRGRLPVCMASTTSQPSRAHGLSRELRTTRKYRTVRIVRITRHWYLVSHQQ